MNNLILLQVMKPASAKYLYEFSASVRPKKEFFTLSVSENKKKDIKGIINNTQIN